MKKEKRLLLCSIKKIIVAMIMSVCCLVQAETLRPGETEVVVARKAALTTVFAATEATNFLSRILGCDVPVVNSPTAGKISVVLGTNAWTEAAGLSVEKFARDEFCIRRAGSRVYVFGHDEKRDVFELMKRGNANARFRSGGLWAYKGSDPIEWVRRVHCMGLFGLGLW